MLRCLSVLIADAFFIYYILLFPLLVINWHIIDITRSQTLDTDWTRFGFQSQRRNGNLRHI